jgi:HlyD family secretion protein
VALGLIAYSEAYSVTAGASEKPKAPVTATVDRGAVTTQVGTTGSVEPAETRSLSFTISSTVTSISVQTGETVQAGQTLAEVDGTDATQTVSDDQTALDDAEQQLTDARDNASKTSAATNGATSGGSGTGCATQATYALPASHHPSTSPTANPSRSARPTPSPTPSESTSPTPSPSPSESTSPTPSPSPSESTSPTPSPSPSESTSPTPSPSPSQTTSPAPSPSPSVTTSKPTAHPTAHATTTSPAEPGGGTVGGGSGSCSGRTGSGGTGSGGTSSGSGTAGAGQQGSGSDPILSAQQQVISATSTLENAEDALDGATMTAPIAGKILSIGGKVGSQVSSGSTFITLADTYNMLVNADFPEADADRLAVGQSAVISLPAQADQTFKATVEQVDPAGTSDGTMVRYGVLLSFVDAPKDLLVGQSATVTVTTGSKMNVLRVPSTAVHNVAGASGTVLKNGVQVSVGVGLRGDQYTEITSGLPAGDQVVRSW